MTVFDAFPNAVETWLLYEKVQNTETGKTLGEGVELHVIVDEVGGANEERSLEAQYLDSDTLLYAKPEELPTLSKNKLLSDYAAFNAETETYYDIREVGIGKNQETGVVEHYELKIRATEVADED